MTKSTKSLVIGTVTVQIEIEKVNGLTMASCVYDTQPISALKAREDLATRELKRLVINYQRQAGKRQTEKDKLAHWNLGCPPDDTPCENSSTQVRE
jgi:hypothetical protein